MNNTINNFLTEVKNSGTEMKKALEVDIMLRRYQYSLLGQEPWEVKLISACKQASEKLLSSWRAVLKRGLDMICAGAGIVLASPLLIVVALAVKVTSKGPVFYSQTRVGENGKLFKMYKFRSMRQDAEIKTGPTWARKDDPRVTPIGNFLRTSHLDELPQLFNVFMGSMSLVGPRPERPFFVEELKKVIPQYENRLKAKPGITGLAQIRRSYDETLADVRKKVRYDRLYIAKMCPFLDMKVLLLTVGTVVFRTGR